MALIALSSVLFAFMAVLARTLAGQMSAGQLVVIRFLVGLCGVAVVFALRRRGPVAPRPGLLLLRGLLGGLAVYFYFLAIETVGVGPATLLNYTAPVYAAVFAAIFLGERSTWATAGALLLATAGAAVVAWSTLDPTRPFSLAGGAWAGMLSAILAGAAMVSIRSLRGDTDAPTVFLSFCAFGALVGLPFAVGRWTPLTPSLLLPALGVGVLAFAAQLLFTYAFAFVSASSGSAATQVTPLVSWVLAVALLHEVPRPLTIVGALVCVSGVLWGAVGARRA
ncbi:MAG: DMT family transporter [Myxococcaceae bacterium]